jgi:N-acetyl-gamma-glutamyl-phosphate reductase
MGYRVAVAGASGYAGGELLRLISAHPDLEVAVAAAHGQAGARLGAVHPHLRTLADLTLADTTPQTLADADLVFLALPHGASGPLAAQLPGSVKIVDLGADHRLLDAAAYERYYAAPHPGTWTYGLPELPGQREKIAASTRVANTGCYAVCITVALAPLVAAGVAAPDDVVVVAASGTTGAGAAPKRHLLGSEVMGDLSPYKVGAHQHVPEILQATGAHSLAFTPILAPMPRGILASVNARPQRPVDAAEVREILAAAYDGEPFIHVLPPGQVVHTGATLGSNSVHIQADIDVSTGRIIVTSGIDNIGKGAAGQAVQNANLLLGLPETAGLAVDGVAP